MERKDKQTKIFLSMITQLLLFLSILFSQDSFSTTVKKSIGYDLIKPDTIFFLPEILHEISGLTAIDSNSFACIQDELGIVFIYDLKQKEITNQLRFAEKGDYEDITRVGKKLFILRSDGVLFEISNYDAKETEARSYSTDIPCDNNEGLCYDRNNERLLIAPKVKLRENPIYNDMLVIFGFDLNSRNLLQEPVAGFQLTDINQFALNHSINLHTKKKKQAVNTESGIQIRPSAVGIHPLTNDLYILSGADKLLLVFNRNGNVEHIEKLDPHLFNKAEGIAFLENGDMFISNEGKDKQPTILRFNYHQ